MKKTLFVLFLFLCASAAFGQGNIGGYSRSTQVQVYGFESNPAHASYAALSPEVSVLSGNNYAVAQGERPASDFPHAEAQSLGEIARQLRKQHELAKKSPIVYVNQ
jgi:hypothetical protein